MKIFVRQSIFVRKAQEFYGYLLIPIISIIGNIKVVCTALHLQVTSAHNLEWNQESFLKAFGLIVILLTAAGAGLTLWLPGYPPSPAAASFLKPRPVTHTELSLSGQLMPGSAVSSDRHYGLQLYMSSSPAVIEAELKQLEAAAVKLPLTPVVFAVSEDDRHWLILAVGPFAERPAAEQLQFSLTGKGQTPKLIAWPTD